MTDSAGAQRVEEIRQALVKSSHPQGWWYMAAHDLLKQHDALTAGLRAVEEDADYWKRACAAEKARHDESLSKLRAVEGERAQHEKCIEEIQADQLVMAEHENELHDQKDRLIADLQAEARRLREALTKARIFIEYARYELDPGKSRIGDQFPKQDDADAEMANIDAALTPPRPAGGAPAPEATP